MKQDKKPDNDLKRIGKIAAGTAASVAVLAGGVHLWNGYQNGSLFHPDLFVSNHDYQENQIMFPEKKDYSQSSQADKSDENRRLERDPQSNDSYGKDKQEEPEYRVSSDASIQTDIQNASNLLIDPGNIQDPVGSIPQGFENSAAIISNTSGDNSHSVIQVPAGTTNGIGNGAGLSSRKDDYDSDSDSDSGSYNSGNTSGGGTSSGGGGGGGGDNGTGSTTPVDPSPTPDPAPTPTPTPTPVPEPTPVVDPDYPNDGDKPTLPDNPSSWVVFPDFPSDGLPSGERAETARLTLATPLDDSGETLYYGAVLTDWKLLCSIYAFVDVTNSDGSMTRYRLTDYNDNFRIGEFPSVVDGDFTVSFYFRPNADSEWQEYQWDFSVKYAKVIVLDNADGSVLTEKYLDKNGRICLLNQLNSYYQKHYEEWGLEDQTWESLDAIFPGWSLTPDGEPVGNWFAPEEPGRYVLYPLDRVELPDDFWVYRSQGWDNANDGCYADYLQALLSGPSDQDVLEIPEGIHEIWTISNIGTLILPNSAEFVYPENYSVLNAYQVRDDNPYFSVRDGLLFSKDYTKLLGIPQSYYEELRIPAETTCVELPYANEFKKIIFSSEVPPQIDISRLNNTELIVPKAAYTEYFLAWNQYLLSNNLTLIADDDQIIDFTYINDGLYSEDGRILHRISSSHSGFFTATDNLEIVKEGATDNCMSLTQIFFSDQVRTFEKDSLSASCLKTIYISAETPPEIDAETFGDLEEALARSLQVIVPDTALEAYLEAWKEVLGDSANELVKGMKIGTVETESGLKYLNTAHGATLLQAPAGITSFDEILEEAGDDVIWTEIGSRAFENCTELTALEIPETVSHIDSGAFVGCSSLEMILFKAEDEITIEQDAFSTDNLKIIALNASHITLDDDNLTRMVSVYVPAGCDINQDNLNLWGTSYAFVAGETGTFAYGLDEPDSDGMPSYLIAATSDVSGAIEPPDGYMLTQFSPYALNGCSNELTISDEVGKSIFYIGPYAFYNSGISGTITLGNMYQIAGNAFYGCSDLKEVVIEESPYEFSLGGYAFGESGLERITLPPNLYSLGSAPFSYCAMLQEIIFTGEEPPILEAFTRGSSYTFGWDDWATWLPPNVKTTLSGDADFDTYLEKWKFYLNGYRNEDELVSVMEDPSEYLFDWLWVAGFPFDDDGNYLPNYLEYVHDAAIANVAEKINEGITKFYWYMNEEVPDGVLQEVIKPDINDYTDGVGDIWDMPFTATASNAAVIVRPESGSNADKATASDSNAGRDLSKDAGNILNSVGFLTDDDESVPQEEN